MSQTWHLKTAFILIFSFISLLSDAKDFHHRVFDETDGLYANTIYDIYQDENGLIWLGSNRGLYRYDGIMFKKYGYEDGLTDEVVFGVFKVDRNTMLLSTLSGRYFYYHKGKIINENEDFNLKRIRSNVTARVTNLDDGSIVLWGVGTPYIKIVHFGESRIKSIDSISLPNHFNVKVTSSWKGSVNIVGSNGEIDRLFKYSIKNKRLEIVTDNPMYTFENATNYSEKEIVYSNKNKLYWSEFENDSFTHNFTSTHSGYIKNFYLDNKVMFVATFDGADLVHNRKIINKFLPNTSVNAAFIDRDGNYWVGSALFGLHLYKKNEALEIEVNSGKNNDLIPLCIEGDSNKVIIGYHELVLKQIVDDQVEEFDLHSDEQIERLKINILDIEFVGKKMCYLATDFGLLEYNLSNKKLRYLNRQFLNKEGEEFRVDLAIKVVKVRNGQCYFGANSGFFRMDLHSNLLEEISNYRTNECDVDRSGRIWFSNMFGLKYKYPNQKPVSINGVLQNLRVNHIECVGDWIFLATNNGLYSNYKQSSFDRFEKWPNIDELIFKVRFFEQALWVTSDRGLIKIDLYGDDNTSFQIVTTEDGLNSNIVRDVFVRNDTCWVATKDGLSVLKISHFLASSIPPIKILYAKNDQHYFAQGEKIIIKPNERSLKIHFASPIYGETIRFKYRLNGSSHWEMTDRNEVLFSALQPGKYIFEVVALNQKGQISKESAILKFEVESRFVESFWFQLSIWVFIFILLFLLVLWNFRRLRAKERKKSLIQQQVASLELEAIKAQINPHFIYNSLNSIKYSIIRGDSVQAENQLTVFAKLIRKTLQFSKMDFISLEQELEYLKEYALIEKLRFKDSLDILFATQDTLNVSILIPSLLIQPFVENAVKHGRSHGSNVKSIIQVKIIQDKDYLVCEIEDNGRGIDERDKGKNTSFGINISSQRAKTYNIIYQLGVKIEFENKGLFSDKESGTIVKVKIPINKLPKPNESLYNRR